MLALETDWNSTCVFEDFDYSVVYFDVKMHWAAKLLLCKNIMHCNI